MRLPGRARLRLPRHPHRESGRAPSRIRERSHHSRRSLGRHRRLRVWPPSRPGYATMFHSRRRGGVAEWSKAAVLKTASRFRRDGGSNPSSSATHPTARGSGNLPWASSGQSPSVKDRSGRPAPAGPRAATGRDQPAAQRAAAASSASTRALSQRPETLDNSASGLEKFAVLPGKWPDEPPVFSISGEM